MSELNYIERETGPRPTATVIWLHGLGASGHDFEPIVPELRLPENAAVRFIFPHAPEMPVTINGGMRMPAWYDIKAMDVDRVIDTQQLRRSAAAVVELIDAEISRGIDSSKIILAGFSQGGAVAYEAGLSYPKPLAGLLGLSTYFATADSVALSEANRGLAIQVFHGVYDGIVPEALGRKSVTQLEELGFQPEYTTYPMDHSVCLEEVLAIGQFLRSRLGL
ncbi:alpha/beta hydrolase [Marinobacter sp. SS21]|uniref:alpha/beta hydrolase n=1 Tax=Marinobacter sp. SS21 TaxID=2979460 RepID=UPI00232D1B83|nr:alpha/beta fold hydrolase [Marinobacter sp. SS21]MDC0664297.1 carboxylesterase [Marinobacter sp. SS21]